MAKAYQIRKSYGKWSSSTVVEMLNRKGDTATVKHLPTKEIFEIPVDYLVERRNRDK